MITIIIASQIRTNDPDTIPDALQWAAAIEVVVETLLLLVWVGI